MKHGNEHDLSLYFLNVMKKLDHVGEVKFFLSKNDKYFDTTPKENMIFIYHLKY